MPALTDEERKAFDRAYRNAEAAMSDDQKRRLLAHPDILTTFAAGAFNDECEFGFYALEAPSGGARISKEAWARLANGEVRVSYHDYPVDVDYREKKPEVHLAGLKGIGHRGHDPRVRYDGYGMERRARASGGILPRVCKLMRFDLEVSHQEIQEVLSLVDLEEVDPRTLATIAAKHQQIFEPSGVRLCATSATTRIRRPGSADDYFYARMERQSLGHGASAIMYELEDMIGPTIDHFRANFVVLVARPLPDLP